MNLIISTPDGEVFDGEVSFIKVHNQEGEFAVLKDHIPIISLIQEGYIKFHNNNAPEYVVIVNAVFEFKDNSANVLAQEASHGTKSLEEAKNDLNKMREARRIANKKQMVDYTKVENDLKKNIKASGAGKL